MFCRWMQEVVEEDEDAVEDDLFDFLPESLNLPDERQELIQRIKQSDHLWIIKVRSMYILCGTYAERGVRRIRSGWPKSHRCRMEPGINTNI